MSTEVQPQDAEALRQAIKDIRSDESGPDRKMWVLVGHIDSNPNEIGVVASDTSEEATIEDFRAKLEDDQVMYGLIRLTTAIDMSNTVRFVYVHW